MVTPEELEYWRREDRWIAQLDHNTAMKELRLARLEGWAEGFAKGWAKSYREGWAKGHAEWKTMA